MDEQNTRRLTGWGRLSDSKCRIYRPKHPREIPKILSLGNSLPYGNGRSFGDASLNDAGNLVATPTLAQSKDLSLDRSTGILQCSSGVTQKEILKVSAPLGWALPAIPGSQGITVGGSLAADCHGKNHFTRGSISRHLISMRIMLANGEIVEASRETMPDLFWATVGGLGLTGVIISAKINLHRISSVYAIHTMKGFNDVDDMIDVIEENKADHEYLLGSVDGKFQFGKPWQGSVAVGSILPSGQVEDSWRLPVRHTLKLPFPNLFPWADMLAGKIISHIIRRKFRDGRIEIVDLIRFFFPQDAIVNWNLAFGGAGFVDYQCCVPVESGREFFKIIHKFLNKHNVFCFLVAIKRFRSPEWNGPLTFSQDGFSIALDIPIRPGVLELLHLMDEIVLEFGGRVNLIKDARISPSMFRRMYPRVNEWLEIKEKYDPEQVFNSNLSRRLGLTTL